MTSATPARSRRRFRRWPHTPLARGHLALLAMLVALTVVAWALTVYQAETMDLPMGVVVRGAAGGGGMAGTAGMASSGMAGMAAAGWSVGGAAMYLAAWAVMMAAMMLPAAAPMLLLFATVQARRREQPSFAPTWVFAAGYLLVWTAVGLAVYLLVRLGSGLAGDLGSADRAAWAPPALGATLMAAGLYQLTPLKRVCLDHCRSPLGFVMAHWREGWLGALRMGIIHGGYCLGCCWALFAVLVGAGVMSLAWMALLTLIVFAEKVLPLGRYTARAVGAALLILGLVVAAGAIDLPWVA